MTLFGTEQYGWDRNYQRPPFIDPAVVYNRFEPPNGPEFGNITLEPTMTSGLITGNTILHTIPRILHKQRAPFIFKKKGYKGLQNPINAEQQFEKGTREFFAQQFTKTHPTTKVIIDQNPQLKEVFDPFVTDKRKIDILQKDPNVWKDKTFATFAYSVGAKDKFLAQPAPINIHYIPPRRPYLAIEAPLPSSPTEAEPNFNPQELINRERLREFQQKESAINDYYDNHAIQLATLLQQETEPVSQEAYNEYFEELEKDREQKLQELLDNTDSQLKIDQVFEQFLANYVPKHFDPLVLNQEPSPQALSRRALPVEEEEEGYALPAQEIFERAERAQDLDRRIQLQQELLSNIPKGVTLRPRLPKLKPKPKKISGFGKLERQQEEESVATPRLAAAQKKKATKAAERKKLLRELEFRGHS